ncbi:MAG: 50S ribosomal protein L11 methyltransferase [Betaproteobacteria bacterium]
MPYLALRLDVPAGEVENWSDALLEGGALAVDAADANAGTSREVSLFGEPGSATEVWPQTRLTVLFDAASDAAAALARASARIALPAPAYSIEPVPDDDWVRRTQSQFAPVHASPRIWIVPTWCEPPDTAAINVRIDPGLAFGTGSHATTRLCLRWLDDSVSAGRRVLDYGCGSGILAIAAAKLGASEICAVDVDADAIASCSANAEANGVSLWCGTPDRLHSGVFDVVVANILANPLQQLAASLAARVRIGGDIVLSGVLEAEAAAVNAAYARWFNIDVWAKEEGWVSLAGRRNRDHG